MRQDVSVVLSHPVCGTPLWQPQDIDTPRKEKVRQRLRAPIVLERAVRQSAVTQGMAETGLEISQLVIPFHGSILQETEYQHVPFRRRNRDGLLTSQCPSPIHPRLTPWSINSPTFASHERECQVSPGAFHAALETGRTLGWN